VSAAKVNFGIRETAAIIVALFLHLVSSWWRSLELLIGSCRRSCRLLVVNV
jgi:hypothetical protein